MKKFQERTIYISISILGLFLVVSLVSNNWGFFLWSLLPVFMSVMCAFFTKKNKYIEKFNQGHSN